LQETAWRRNKEWNKALALPSRHMYSKYCFNKRKKGTKKLFSKIRSGKKELVCGAYNEENAKRDTFLHYTLVAFSSL